MANGACFTIYLHHVVETDRAYRFVVAPDEELLRKHVAQVKVKSGNPWGGSKLEIIEHKGSKPSPNKNVRAGYCESEPLYNIPRHPRIR